MFGSQILETAIGLVLVYSLMSIISSALTEWLASILGLRAKTLKTAISSLVGQPDSSVQQKIYQHPLIKSLSKPGKYPTYIPASRFVAALLDSLAILQKSPSDPKTMDAAAAQKVRQEVEAAIAQVSDQQLRESLLAVWNHAGRSFEVFSKELENWFDETMERFSGWYKRQAQLFVLLFATVVTLTLNVDTNRVATALWNNQTLRESLVAEASKTTSSPNAPSGEQQSAGQDQKTGAGQQNAETSDKKEGGQQETDEMKRIDQTKAKLLSLGLPIGWADFAMRPLGSMERIDADKKNDRLTLREGIRMSLLGWLFTILAIAQGAPFWFDILNNLLKLNTRISGKKPE